MKKIITLTAPSGAGKTTLMNDTFDNGQIIRSVVTRPMRPGEIDGEDYYFISEQEFKKLKANGELLQEAHYNGNSYGLTMSEVLSRLEKYDTVIVAVVYPTIQDIIQGIEHYNAQHEEQIQVESFFLTISHDVLLKHFESRTESDEQKEERIAKYDSEMENAKHFDDNHIISMDQGSVLARKELLTKI